MSYLSLCEATSSPIWVQVRDGPVIDPLEDDMAWIALIVAGLFEIVWAFSIKQSDGFTRLWPSLITFVTVVLSFGLLAWSMRTLPLGTAYMVWTGIGALGAFIIGVVFLGEAMSAFRLVAAGLIVSGLLMMKLAS
jgi:quaternary ammonium compound-resistance protein SugE